MKKEDKKLLNYATYVADIINNKKITNTISSSQKQKHFFNVNCTITVKEVSKRYIIIDYVFNSKYLKINNLLNVTIYCNLNLSPNKIFDSIKNKSFTHLNEYLDNNNIDREKLIEIYMGGLFKDLINSQSVTIDELQTKLEDIKNNNNKKYL